MKTLNYKGYVIEPFSDYEVDLTLAHGYNVFTKEGRKLMEAYHFTSKVECLSSAKDMVDNIIYVNTKK